MLNLCFLTVRVFKIKMDKFYMVDTLVQASNKKCLTLVVSWDILMECTHLTMLYTFGMLMRNALPFLVHHYKK